MMTPPKTHKAPEGPRAERMRASPHYRAGKFINTYPLKTVKSDVSMASAMLQLFTPSRRRTPSKPLPAQNPTRLWATPIERGLRATWLGHSTVLLEMDGARVLIDPIWSNRASPVSFMGPKRFQPVPVSIADLPVLDAVLVSHDHYDHLDRQTVLALAKRCQRFVTSLGVGAHMERWGIPSSYITELDWWESIELANGLKITAAPAHHFSGRRSPRSNGTLWSSFAFQSATASVYFGGDSGLTTAFSEIGQRLGPFDLVMLEIGAFHPAWDDMHLGPDGAFQAWTDIGSGLLLPLHWGTFKLAAHAWNEPADTIYARMPKEKLVMPLLGEPFGIENTPDVSPWWRF